MQAQSNLPDFTRDMTPAEREALCYHNLCFTIPAAKILALPRDPYRFVVVYSGGHFKWDYSTGDHMCTREIMRRLGY